ncbi:unnamed protein product [Gemmataceae bacterium]|nr:unnamed protein product [Gemmataceae bacterium]VTT98865.1 unnamed protein product [Gemmataceae bacterium]
MVQSEPPKVQSDSTPTEPSAGPIAPESADAPRLTRLVVRSRYSSAVDKVFEHTDPREALRAALANTTCTQPAPEIIADGTDDVAFLDIDAHDAARRPDEVRFEMAAARLARETGADAHWRTHGGGTRLVFTRRDRLTAGELAAVARVHARRLLRGLHGVTGIEIKSTSAHPAYPRATPGGELRCSAPVWLTPADVNLRAIAADLLGAPSEADPEAAAECREERGWTLGGRYQHPECPFDPSPSGHDAVEASRPVVVLDEGVWCHKCARFTPYAQLVEPEKRRPGKDCPLRQCVRGMAHFTHARHVLAHHAGVTNERDARLLYGALLKLWHLYGPRELDDLQTEATLKLINDAATCNVPVVWVAGCGWVSSNTGNPARPESVTKLLPTLPAVKYVGDEGEVGTSARTLAALLSDDDAAAAAAGYPPLRPIRGVDFFGQVGDPDVPGTPFVLAPGRTPFKYRRREERERVEHVGCSAWELVERQFPGINRGYLKLCIAGPGYTQRAGITENVAVNVTGVSGSGKTTTAELGADMAGVTCTSAKLKADEDKLARAAATAAGGVLVLDEVAKAGLSGDELLSRLQSIKVGAEYHALYRGSARLTAVPFVVLADTQMPRVVQEEIQLRRRLVGVALGAGRVTGKAAPDWNSTSGGVTGWRERGPLRYSLPGLGAMIADCVVSEVVDEVRALGPGATFVDYARTLGFGLLSDATADEVDHDAPFRALFDAVLATDPVKDSKKFQGKGWVVFDPDDGSKVAAAWRECASSEGFSGPKPQLITGRQWGVTTGVDGLHCQLVQHGKKVGLRFLVGAVRSPNVRYHRDVLGGAVPTVPTPGGAVPTGVPTAKTSGI